MHWPIQTRPYPGSPKQDKASPSGGAHPLIEGKFIERSLGNIEPHIIERRVDLADRIAAQIEEKRGTGSMRPCRPVLAINPEIHCGRL